MVKLTKRPSPPKPIKSEQDYRSNPNFNALAEDCEWKCYICENDKAISLNVEHLIPHRGDDNLKYDWNNLFLSCGHCNNIKLARYDSILNPTQSDPEDYIELSLIIENMKEKILIKAKNVNESVNQTANLLGRVYNGGTTDIKEIECTNLRNAVAENIARFLQYIQGYIDEPDMGYDVIINKEISRSSAFAAFKRKIIREDNELSSVFTNARL